MITKTVDPLLIPGSKVVIDYTKKGVVITEVTKITPAGWIVIKYDNEDRTIRFKDDGFRPVYHPIGESQDKMRVKSFKAVGEKYGTFAGAVLYPFDDDLLQLINSRHQREIDRQEQAKAERQRRADMQELRHAQELAEVKDACDGRLPNCREEKLTDGHRLWQFDLPVKPEHADRKKGFERVIVHCWDAVRTDWSTEEEHPIVEYSFTYLNGSSSSFSSVSTDKAETDEDALWEAACYCYHHW